METQNVSYVTFKEYTQSQDKIKRELLESQNTVKHELTKRLEKAEIQHEKLDLKINGIDDKVDQVKEVVLPLTAAMNSTAENTKQLVISFAKLAEAQVRSTESQVTQTGLFVEKFHTQDLKIAVIENVTKSFADKKTYNLGVTVAAIGFAGIFITGLFQMAPIVMEILFDR